MAERELFVICPNCGSEASPYVTECPYCGNRLRKRAPDLRKLKRENEKADRAAEREAERHRQKTKRLLTGRGRGGDGKFGGGRREEPDYLRGASNRPPLAVTSLILAAVAVSLATRVDGFPLGDLIYGYDLGGRWWQLFAAPLVHLGYGYGFVSLVAVAMFGAGLERRHGMVAVAAIWLSCGAAGVALEHLIAPLPLTNGAIGIATGMMAAWLTTVMRNEDLRDHDAYGLAAVSIVLLAMPLATDEASIWTIAGGLGTGVLAGLVLSRLGSRD